MGLRELLENVSSGPSGVYWACCEKKAVDSVGCFCKSHQTPINDLEFESDYFIRIAL